MITATRAIVLKHFKYAENSIICKIYTEEFGVKSYIISNLRSKKAQNKIGWYQPLTLLDLIVYNKENKQLHHIKETNCSEPLMTIHNHVYKSSMALFVAEMLLKSIKEEEANAVQFAFVRHFIKNLDATPTNFTDYHLIFLLHLTQYLGFYPKVESFTEKSFFDMIEGKFVQRQPLHSTYIDQEMAGYFHMLLNADYDNTDHIKINGKIRQQLLEKIIMFYKTHLEGIGNIYSAEVLKMVFSDN